MIQSPSIPHLSPNGNLENSQAKFSKWISLDVLIDENEIQSLFENLSPLFLLTMQNLSPKTPFLLELGKFLKVYQTYISLLKNGEHPILKDFKKVFYLFLSANLDDLYIRSIGADKEALIFNTPLIEVRPISLTLSSVDQSIRSMPVHPNGILWGLRFSFPQMIQKAGTHDIEQIDFQKHPNGILFGASAQVDVHGLIATTSDISNTDFMNGNVVARKRTK